MSVSPVSVAVLFSDLDVGSEETATRRASSV
jgi:hypothetical protein